MKFIKYWILGILIIAGLFLSFTAPKYWGAYLEYLTSNSIWIWIPQTGFLLISGAVLGAMIYLVKEAVL